MQTINSTIQHSETPLGLVQRGNAEIHSAVGVQMNHTQSKDVYRFPGATPQQKRVRPVTTNTNRTVRTAAELQKQQIESARVNAYSHFQKKPERQMTPEEVQAWAQWAARTGEVIEYFREQKLNEQPKSLVSGTVRMLTGSRSAANLFTTRPTRRQLIQQESEIGGQLFGVIPENHHRQFFDLDKGTWIWYEEWTDAAGKSESTTTRYEVHDNGILKVQDNAPYYFIEGNEMTNLTVAMRSYYERVSREIYHRDPATAKPLAV